jgi:hypothetical protein
MANVPCWEWRAFGGVSAAFARKYSELEPCFELQDVEDLYLWIPGLSVNAKFRMGAEGGLKFKRIKDKDLDLEKWHEDKAELFDFPLEREAWETLSRMLATVGVTLANYPSETLNRDKSLQLLENAGCEAVKVRKKREARLWKGPYGKVKVEWACISEPQSLISIGLETWMKEPSDRTTTDDEGKKDIKAAIDDLGIVREPLRIMNYMDAVQIWASREKI